MVSPWPAAGTEAVRWGLALGMLAGAALSDLRTRRVPNAYWWPFGAFALFLALGDLGGGLRRAEALILLGVPALLCLLLFLFWRLRLFGGADAKGLMVLAFLLPHSSLSRYGLVPTVDALVNACLLALGLPAAFLALNLARGRWAGAATFLGYPMPLEEARERHVWPMQRVVDGQVRWRLWPRIGESYAEALAGLAQAGVARVWVTPKVPMMLLLAAGLAVGGVAGNLVLRLGASLGLFLAFLLAP